MNNVLVMSSAKCAAISSLRIASPVAFSDRDPAISTHRLARRRVDLFKPRDDQRWFWFELTVGDVVIRQRAVEWILVRYEGYGNIIASRRGIRCIEAAIISRPIEIPRASVIRHRVVSA